MSKPYRGGKPRRGRGNQGGGRGRGGCQNLQTERHQRADDRRHYSDEDRDGQRSNRKERRELPFSPHRPDDRMSPESVDRHYRGEIRHERGNYSSNEDYHRYDNKHKEPHNSRPYPEQSSSQRQQGLNQDRRRYYQDGHQNRDGHRYEQRQDRGSFRDGEKYYQGHPGHHSPNRNERRYDHKQRQDGQRYDQRQHYREKSPGRDYLSRDRRRSDRSSPDEGNYQYAGSKDDYGMGDSKHMGRKNPDLYPRHDRQNISQDKYTYDGRDGRFSPIEQQRSGSRNDGMVVNVIMADPNKSSLNQGAYHPVGSVPLHPSAMPIPSSYQQHLLPTHSGMTNFPVYGPPPPLMAYPVQPPPPYSNSTSNLTKVYSGSCSLVDSNSSRSYGQNSRSSFSSESKDGADDQKQKYYRERGRGRGGGRSGRSGRSGRGRGDRKYKYSDQCSEADSLERSAEPLSAETTPKLSQKETFLFLIFKNMLDENFEYVEYIKMRTEELKSVSFEVQALMKSGESKVVLVLCPSKASANKIIKHFKKTNSSNKVEVLCYCKENLPSQYSDLAKIDFDKKTRKEIESQKSTEETKKVEDEPEKSKQKNKRNRKQQQKDKKDKKIHETNLYIAVNSSLKNEQIEDFLRTRMGQGSMYPFEFISATVNDKGTSTYIQIKTPSEAMATNVMKQLDESNQDSGTTLTCSLVPFNDESVSRKDRVEQVLKDIVNLSKEPIENHELKIQDMRATLEEFSINPHVSVDEFERKVSERDAIKDKLDELVSQGIGFQSFIEKMKIDLIKNEESEHFDSFVIQQSRQLGIERCRLSTALPIYARRKDILSCILNNRVTILKGATGSGKSTQITQYLYESGILKDKMVVCTQPRKVACVSLASRVADELTMSVGHLVGYKTGAKQKLSKNTRILFMTDHTLLNECLKDPLLMRYSVIIIDEAHERSIYTDILLGILKKCLQERIDLKVIISSATIDTQIFSNYFQSSQVIEVAGRTFPVEIFWKSEEAETDSSDSYENEAVKMAIRVHQIEGRGDILVFLTNPLETERCKAAFEEELGDTEDYKCLTLHGQLSPQDQQLVFNPLPDTQRKIVFATNTAETSITIPGIKYVIDAGLAKEMTFDPKRNINCLALNVISQSSAEQRKGRAGRTEPGKCYRLYSEETYNEMKSTNVPEILRVHIGQALLKLLELGIDPSKYDFVESPSREALDSAIKTLIQLNAVNNGKITEHGRWLAKIPFEPRLSSIVKNGYDNGFVYDALVLSTLINTGSFIFYRGGSDEDKNRSDVSKTQFCHSNGDCFTFLKVFKEWSAVPKNNRAKWCMTNYINSKSIQSVEETVSEVFNVLKREAGVQTPKEFSSDEAVEESLQKSILSAFSDNIAHFMGHRKAGYYVPSIDQQVFIHPSSSLKVLNDSSAWVVFANILRTSTDFITTVTPVKEEWIRSLMGLPFDISVVKDKKISILHTECFGQTSFSIFVGQRYIKIRKYEEMLSQICGFMVMIDADRDLGEVHFNASNLTAEAREAIEEWRNEARAAVEKKFGEFQLGSKPSKNGATRIILGKGGEGKVLLMPNEYRTVYITKPNCQTTTKSNILCKFSRYGEILDIWEDSKSKTRWGNLTFSSFAEAKLAVEDTKHDEAEVAIPDVRQSEKRDFQFKARLTWLRRPSKNFALVDIDHVYLAQAVRTGFVNVRGKLVKIELNDNSTGLKFRNLPQGTTEQELKECLIVALGFSESEKESIHRVTVIREKSAQTSASELETIKKTISEHVSEFLKSHQFMVDVVKPKKGSDINYVAFIKFVSAEDGYNACNALNKNFMINNQTVTMVPDISASINISERVYNVMGKLLDETIEALKKNKLEFRYHVKELNTGRVILNIYSTRSTDLAQVRAILEGVLKGEVIECWRNENYRHLFLSTGRQFIRRVEDKTNTVIQMDERKNTITIYGAMSDFTTAQRELEDYLKDVVNGTGKEIDLRAPDRPKGLMKALMKRYGLNLENLAEEANLQSILLQHKTQKVTVIGEPVAVDTAFQIINDISTSLFLETQYSRDETGVPQGDSLPECCACFCPVESLADLYRLEYCGHPYCLDCFEGQIRVAIQGKDLPVLCSQNDCQKPLVWADFANSFKKVKIEPKGLVAAAVTNFMLSLGRGIYHHCLTPDCPVIYKTDIENPRFICEECGLRICSSCHIEYHDGLSCDMYKKEEMDRDMIEEYLRQNASTVRACPQCHIAIEKNHGCNHMLCTACKTSFCWHCLESFATAGECYDHLVAKHGSIAGIDDLLYHT